MIAGKRDFGKLMEYNMKIYADEVNSSRAIPDLRDGLKPVQRKILYWLSQNKGVKEFRGCAEVSGGVTGAYHPHSDEASYLAIARLSQPLIMGYPLVDFQGNNGSLTDPPAAKRYTKCRLSKYGMALLTDIDVPDVVEYMDNYNETLKEPRYLLGTLSSLNLLINPQIGIGLATACNFLPHNIEDVKVVLKYRMEHPNCKFEDLPPLYPSFHKGGVIVNKDDISMIYKTGHGTVVLRGKYHFKDNVMYITEFPYRVDATAYRKYLITHPITGISEVYEQNGVIKIYPEKGADLEEIEKVLLKKTALQSSYAVNMTATDIDGKPRVFTLLEILDTHIKLQHHRITKVAEHTRDVCAQKLHINEGLEKALDDIDEVISIIRNSESPAIAESNLVEKLNIDNSQAKAILDIRLARLSHMEIEAVRQEIRNLKGQIEREQQVIESKELREAQYWTEVMNYTDNTPRTECLSLMNAGRDGDKIKSDGYAIFDRSFFEYHTSEDQFEDGIVPRKYEAATDWYIITSHLRGFTRKGTDLPVGRTDWEDILPLEEGEEVVYLENPAATEKYEYLLIDTKDGKRYKMHNSFVSCGCSQRGKRLTKGKYEVELIQPGIPTSEDISIR